MCSEWELADGLAAWMRGEDGPDVEATRLVLAETLLMWRAVLKSKMKK